MFDVFRHKFLNHIHVKSLPFWGLHPQKSLSQACCYARSLSFKGISWKQHKILHVTLICMKLHLRGGPSFDIQLTESFLTLNTVMFVQWGMGVARALGWTRSSTQGSSSSILQQMKRCQGCTTGVCSHICSCGGTAVCSRSRDFPFRCPADIIIDITGLMLPAEWH